MSAGEAKDVEGNDVDEGHSKDGSSRPDEVPDEVPDLDGLTRSTTGRARIRPLGFVAVALLATVLIVGSVIGRPGGVGVPGAAVPVGRAASDEVRIAGVELANFDPALSGDIASGAILANLYEGRPRSTPSSPCARPSRAPGMSIRSGVTSSSTCATG